MNPKDQVTTIDILRHGQTEGGEIFRGSTDVSLNTEGLQEMWNALNGMTGWQHIISSPLQRCLYFSELLAQEKAIEHSTNMQLCEISFGDWDGKAFTDIQQETPELFNQFWRDPLNYMPPNAESIEAFCARVRAGFWQEIQQHQGKHLLMVVHGGVVRAILSEVLQTPMLSLMRFDVPYACVTRLKIYHEQEKCWPQLIFHNPLICDGEKK
jgi:alpha-ribazole phosphatase